MSSEKLTAKQQVLKIYPYAEFIKFGVTYFAVVSYKRDKNGRKRSDLEFASYSYFRPVNAWKNAWKMIQKDMLLKLK